MLLAGISVLLALLIAIPLGFLQALRRNKPVDYALTGLTFIFYSTPAFWLALVLITLFAIHWQLLPAQAPQGNFKDIVSHPEGLVLPVMTIVLVSVAFFSRYVRSSTLENLLQDYVRTARAKGASTRRVAYRHVLRNALVPVVTLVGVALPFIFAGTLISEEVFNYPGMGLLYLQRRRRPRLPGAARRHAGRRRGDRDRLAARRHLLRDARSPRPLHGGLSAVSVGSTELTQERRRRLCRPRERA